MKKFSIKAIIIMEVILVTISGCSKHETKMVRIDRHVFNVPQKHLFEGTIPWLPASQHNGLMFYVNPEAPLPERNIVLIESTASTCPPDTPYGSYPLAAVCRAAVQKEEDKQEEELEKVHLECDRFNRYCLKRESHDKPKA